MLTGSNSSRQIRQNPGRHGSHDSRRTLPKRQSHRRVRVLPPIFQARRQRRPTPLLQSRSFLECLEAAERRTVPPPPSPAAEALSICRRCLAPLEQTPAEHPSPTFTRTRLEWWVVLTGRMAGDGPSPCPLLRPHQPCPPPTQTATTAMPRVQRRGLARVAASYCLPRHPRFRRGPPLQQGLRLGEPVGCSLLQGSQSYSLQHPDRCLLQLWWL